MNTRAAALAVAAAAALAAPAAAQAMTVGIQGGELRVIGERGEANMPSIAWREGGEVEFVQDFETEPGPGCRRAPNLVCAPGNAIVVTLGDGADFLEVGHGLPAPLRYSGGPGRDTVSFGGPGARADNDGNPDDGPAGRDDIEADVEVIGGSVGPDLLGSGRFGASINGRDGDDTIGGGSGADRITAAYIATDGTEAGELFPEGVDRVSCGRGQDFVVHDSNDVVAKDCEAVGRPTPEDPARYYLFRGSSGDDFMGAPAGWDPARMYAGSGDDVVQPPQDGSSRVELGPGRDRLRSVGGVHVVHAGSGNDFIDVRTTGGPPDRVDCGPGRDRVIANDEDRIGRDCESVSRASGTRR
jgi:hypothetical protein